MKALRFLESFQEKTEPQKLQFVLSLPELFKKKSGEFVDNIELLR